MEEVLAKVFGGEEFLEADEFGAGGGGLADEVLGFFEIAGDVGGAGHLDDGDGEAGGFCFRLFLARRFLR